MSKASVGDRLLSLLVAIARHGAPVPVKVLAKSTGQPLSTVYRNLGALRRWGLVSEIGPDAGYGPGPASIQLAWGFDTTSHLMSVARPELLRIADRTKESVALMAPVAGHAMCLDMVESSQSLRCSYAKGRSLPLVRGASAKALLAFLPEADREAIIATHLDADSAEAARLRKSLATIRRQGYAESEGEIDAGVWGTSAPVFATRGAVAGAISLMAPAFRIERSHDVLIRMIAQAAACVSKRLQSTH